MTMDCVLGIDIGSASSKGVLLRDQEVLGSCTCPSGGNFQSSAEKIREILLRSGGLSSSEIARTVATGYGSQQVLYADEVRTEISCHAKGAFFLLPSVRTWETCTAKSFASMGRAMWCSSF